MTRRILLLRTNWSKCLSWQSGDATPAPQLPGAGRKHRASQAQEPRPREERKLEHRGGRSECEKKMNHSLGPTKDSGFYVGCGQSSEDSTPEEMGADPCLHMIPWLLCWHGLKITVKSGRYEGGWPNSYQLGPR